jgi:hypothetical protein
MEKIVKELYELYHPNNDRWPDHDDVKIRIDKLYKLVNKDK